MKKGKYVASLEKESGLAYVHYIEGNRSRLIATIPRYYLYNLGMAQGIVKLLNKGEIVLDLSV
jgi:hypothetical protein